LKKSIVISIVLGSQGGLSDTVLKKAFVKNLNFSNPYIFAILCRTPLIFQTLISKQSNNQSWNYNKGLHHHAGYESEN